MISPTYWLCFLKNLNFSYNNCFTKKGTNYKYLLKTEKDRVKPHTGKHKQFTGVKIMISKKIFSISLVLLIVGASFSFATLTAEASDEEYHLILTSTEGGSITIPDDDEDGPVYNTYDEGTNVNIEAEADDNYEFVEWTGDTQYIGDYKAESTNIEMNDNYTVTAEFEKETHELSVDTEGEGSVDLVPDEEEYEHGENVVIKAEAADNYVFEEWSGDTNNIEDTDESTTIITMEDDYEITAEFEDDYYELSVDVDGEGQILQPDGEGDHEKGRDDEVVIEAKADDHYEFKRWSGDNETINRMNSNITTIEMEDDYDITAEFEKKSYELSIDVDGEGQVLRPGEGDFEYEYDETVVLEAEAEEMHRFERWTGDTDPIAMEDLQSDLITITMEDDYDITAEFEEDYHELSIDSDEEGEVIRPGEGDYEYEIGEEIVIEADAYKNYEFDRWTGDTEGIQDPSSELTTIIMDDDYDITAEFEKEKYELSLDVDGEGEIIRPSEESTTHEQGDEVILEVEADDGYEFSGWSGDNETITDPDSELTDIEMLDDHDVTAEFESENIELKIEWGVIAVLAIVLIFVIVKNQKAKSEREQEENKKPKEGICENCGEIVPIDSRDCPECGAPLAPPDLPELQKASPSEKYKD